MPVDLFQRFAPDTIQLTRLLGKRLQASGMNRPRFQEEDQVLWFCQQSCLAPVLTGMSIHPGNSERP